jgi:preprotein translocase subunit YajC
MVPTDFASWISAAALTQATNPPAVPGAAGAGNGVPTQGAPTPSGPATGTGQAPANPFGGMFWILIPALLLMLILPSMGQKKQQRQRNEMLGGLKRNDRVLTTGGIVGSIVEIYDTEVVLRVDEASNTKIRFAKSAVQQVLQSRDNAKTDVEIKPAAAESANAR